MLINFLTLQVFVNGKRKTATFANDDFTITSSRKEIVMKIPAIAATVTLRGVQFSVDLPFRLFNNNTEGQCGESCINTIRSNTAMW